MLIRCADRDKNADSLSRNRPRAPWSAADGKRLKTGNNAKTHAFIEAFSMELIVESIKIGASGQSVWRCGHSEFDHWQRSALFSDSIPWRMHQME